MLSHSGCQTVINGTVENAAVKVPLRAGVGRVALVLALIVLVAVSGAGYYLYQNANQKPDQVTLLLEVKPTYNHFPYYYGLDHGIYADNGIDLTIQPGVSDAQSVSNLAAGKVQFALADVPTAIWAEETANITNVRVVAIVDQRTFFSVFYNTANISSLQDLAGKTGGASNPATSSQTKLFQLLMKLNNINYSSLQMQYGSSSVTTPLFVEGKLQFALRPLDSFGDIQSAAAKNGIKIGFFPFEANGLDTYGSALLTTTQMISENPSLVQRMVTATMKSIVDGVKNPSAAAASLIKYEPQLNETTAVTGIGLLTNCCMTGANSTSNPLSYGWVDPVRMQTTLNLASEGLGVPGNVNASSLYTDQFTKAP